MSRKGSPARDRRDARDLASPNRRAQLNRVFKRDQGICQICHLPCPRVEASREHKIPLSDGGSKDDGNVVLAHRLCNELANRMRQSNLTAYTTRSDGWGDTGEQPRQ